MEQGNSLEDQLLGKLSRESRRPSRRQEAAPSPAPMRAIGRGSVQVSSEPPRRRPERSGGGFPVGPILAGLAILSIGTVGGSIMGLEKANDKIVCQTEDGSMLEDIACGWLERDATQQELALSPLPGESPVATTIAIAPNTTLAPGATATTIAQAIVAPTTTAPQAAERPSLDPDLAGIAGLNGYTIPCEGAPRAVVRRSVVRNGMESPNANWDGIPDSGTIGHNAVGDPIKVYIREACTTENVRTVVIVASIHGSENGGQFVGHELLFNADIPDDWRVIVIPELNRYAIDHGQRKNENAVDLNKNAPVGWESTMSGRTDPSDNNYRGPSPASEPETQALLSFLTALGPVDLALYYHDRLGYAAPVGNTPQQLAEVYAAQVGLKIGKYNNKNDAYVTVDGALDTWYNAATGSPALLIEMTDDQSDPVIQRHVGAVITLMSQIG